MTVSISFHAPNSRTPIFGETQFELFSYNYDTGDLNAIMSRFVFQETFPYTRGTGTADATVVDGYVSLGFSIKRGVVNQKTGVEGPVLVRKSTMEGVR